VLFLRRGGLSLYGVSAATIWYAISIYCFILVLGFLHYLFLLIVGSWLDYNIGRIYLRMFGLVFPHVWGFLKKNTCFFLLLFMLLIFLST
jgi:hypothetical protein